MKDYFRYINPKGEILILGDDGSNNPFTLRVFGGTGNTLGTPQTQKAPFQIGSSLLNQEIISRVVSINVRIIEGPGDDIFLLRQDLASKLAIETVQPGKTVIPGVLQFHRLGLPVLELVAVPQQSPQFSQISFIRNAVDADIEFFAAYPFWREDVQQSITFPQGGLEFPIEFHVEFSEIQFTFNVLNAGNLKTAIVLEAEGENNGFIMKNNTTGEELEVTGNVATGETLIIDTFFGQKTIILRDIFNVETLQFGRININKSDFWSLVPGLNSVTIQLTGTPFSGRFVFKYRNIYAGL